MVSISACPAEDPGSIPGGGVPTHLVDAYTNTYTNTDQDLDTDTDPQGHRHTNTPTHTDTTYTGHIHTHTSPHIATHTDTDACIHIHTWYSNTYTCPYMTHTYHTSTSMEITQTPPSA